MKTILLVIFTLVLSSCYSRVAEERTTIPTVYVVRIDHNDTVAIYKDVFVQRSGIIWQIEKNGNQVGAYTNETYVLITN